MPVGVAADAGLIASTLGKGGGGAGTWDNVLSGAGSLTVYLDYLRLTGDSPAFTGATSVDGGVLVVDGSLGGGVTLPHSAPSAATAASGPSSPATEAPCGRASVDLAPATLAAGSVRFDPYGNLTITVTDAAGSAGAGYDQLVAGDLRRVDRDEPFALSLCSAHDGADGPGAGWDPQESRAGTWPP